MPTIFEHPGALGICTVDSDRRAGQVPPRRAA